MDLYPTGKELHPTTKSARPSEILRSQCAVIRQQDELIELLKSALAATGMSAVPTYAPWLDSLTSQERALVGVLYACYPQVARREQILELLPGYDHVKERQLQIVDAVVHKIRRKLGAETILTERGLGFRMGSVFYDQLPKAKVQPRDERHEPRSFA